jgi:hypothetical protein
MDSANSERSSDLEEEKNPHGFCEFRLVIRPGGGEELRSSSSTSDGFEDFIEGFEPIRTRRTREWPAVLFLHRSFDMVYIIDRIYY